MPLRADYALCLLLALVPMAAARILFAAEQGDDHPAASHSDDSHSDDDGHADADLGHDAHGDPSHGDNGHGNNGHGPEDLIHHADTFYWIAMSERGSMTAIKHGLEYLDEAEKQLPESHPLRREIDALRDDLEYQGVVQGNTHYGLFPLARFVAPTLFTDSRASGSFELIDDPHEVATREALEELIEHVIEVQTVIPQFDVVFVSDPPSRELENEALYQFNRSARFFVHNRRELAKVLNVEDPGVDDIWPHDQLDPSADVLEKMVETWKGKGLFRSSHMLLVRIRLIDEYHGDFFYIAEGRIVETTGNGAEIAASPVLNQYGFCIDRRDMLLPILGLHGLLLVLSLCLYPVLVKLTSHARKMPTWQNTLIFGGLGFLWGRFVLWAVAPVLAEMQPAPETLAIWSFWWPATAGAVFTLAPAIILGFADRRFNWFGSAFATFNRGGALFASITLGSAAFLGQCVLIYQGAGGWVLIPPLVLATVLAAFTVGRALDKTDAMPLTAGIVAGAGKSAALNAAEAKAREHSPGLIALKGTCDQIQDGSNVKPYEPFIEAIAEHFAVNLLAPQGDQMGQIDEALGGIFDHVVPFADILFPPSHQSQTGSKKELFTAISAMLSRLASQHPVMLVLDDVHWIDPASKELLEFLLVEFSDASNCPLAILLSSRADLELAAGFEGASVLAVAPLTTAELRTILVEGLGLEASLAAEVLSAAGEQRNNLHWLFQIIAHLAQQDLLVRRDDGFAWKDPNVKISDHLPDDIRQSLEETIATNAEFRPVLECAACLGQEFSVDLISNGVGVPRLELIHLLDRIEEQTGIVADLREKDDHYAFRSSFFLKVLRKAREINAGGPRDLAMPRRIREYHYRLASALEETLGESNSALYSVANHYYAAGARHAGKALEYSLQAAKASCFQFQHELARKYLAMAEECAAFTHGSDVDFERESLLIHCHQSHVEGKQHVSTAQRTQEYLERHPDSDFEVYRAAAQACYDAGIDTRGQQHFAACVRIAQSMLERFPAPIEQAEANHFLGIGLPTSEREARCQRLRTATELAEQFGTELYDLVQHAVGELPEEQRNTDPVAAILRMCRDNVAAALQSCQQHAAAPWHHWLTGLLGGDRPESSS